MPDHGAHVQKSVETPNSTAPSLVALKKTARRPNCCRHPTVQPIFNWTMNAAATLDRVMDLLSQALIGTWLVNNANLTKGIFSVRSAMTPRRLEMSLAVTKASVCSHWRSVWTRKSPKFRRTLVHVQPSLHVVMNGTCRNGPSVQQVRECCDLWMCDDGQKVIVQNRSTDFLSNIAHPQVTTLPCKCTVLDCGHGHKTRKVHCAINELGEIKVSLLNAQIDQLLFRFWKRVCVLPKNHKPKKTAPTKRHAPDLTTHQHGVTVRLNAAEAPNLVSSFVSTTTNCRFLKCATKVTDQRKSKNATWTLAQRASTPNLVNICRSSVNLLCRLLSGQLDNRNWWLVRRLF